MEELKEVQGEERTEGNIPGEQALFDEQFVWVFKLIPFLEMNSPYTARQQAGCCKLKGPIFDWIEEMFLPVMISPNNHDIPYS